MPAALPPCTRHLIRMARMISALSHRRGTPERGDAVRGQRGWSVASPKRRNETRSSNHAHTVWNLMLMEIHTRKAQVAVFVLSAAVMLALKLGVATAAFGATGGDPEIRAQAVPTKDSVPTKGLMAPLPAEDGKIKAEESSVQGTSE